ncbi:MAG: sugar ABC transporter substrate-binding protein [Anaerolineae bacterium]|nr:sugar ABC transporter substrate-binding protein [Anaerolineae bacterium]
MNRKHCLSLIRLFICVAMLLGAASIARPTAAQGVEITFWSRNTDESLVTPLVKAYNATHKNQVKLTIIPAGDYVQKLGTSIAAGEPPDVIAIDLIYVPGFAAADQLTDLTDQVKKLPFADKLIQSHMRLGVYEGKNYAVPFFGDGSYLVYNKGLFKKAGLDPEKPPTTWAEIMDYSKKITALGGDVKGYYFSGACAGCNAFTFLPLIWASGGDVLNEDGTKATLDNPAVKSALTFYHQLWTEKLVPESAKADNGADFLNAFFTGKIGMMGTGAFALEPLKKEHKDIDFGVGFLPGEKGGKSSFAGGDSISIPKGSKRVAEAWEFITWCLDEKTQLDEYAKINHLVLRSDLANNEFSKQDPRLLVAAEALKIGRTPYVIPYNQIFNDGNGPWLAMFQKAVFDGKIDEAIAQAQTDFTTILTQK